MDGVKINKKKMMDGVITSISQKMMDGDTKDLLKMMMDGVIILINQKMMVGEMKVKEIKREMMDGEKMVGDKILKDL